MIISLLSCLGLFALFAPALIIIFAQYAPISILPFSQYIPSDFVFQIAIYLGIALACIIPLALIKRIKNEKSNNTENKLTVFSIIKYVLLFFISITLGLVLGYIATIKAFYITGNLIPSTAEAKYDIVTTNVTEKIDSLPGAICEYTIHTDFSEKEVYKNFFYPVSVCVTEEVFNTTNTNEPIFFIGKNVSNFGFLIESVATQSDIEAFKAELEKQDTDTETDSSEAENTEEASQ